MPAPPMTVEELLEKITELRHEIRVYEFLIEKLEPFLDHDIGEAKVLEAEGCLIQHVPKEKVRDVIGRLTDTVEEFDSELKKLSGLQVVPKRAPPKKSPLKKGSTKTTTPPKTKGKSSERPTKLAAGVRPTAG